MEDIVIVLEDPRQSLAVRTLAPNYLTITAPRDVSDAPDSFVRAFQLRVRLVSRDEPDTLLDTEHRSLTL